MSVLVKYNKITTIGERISFLQQLEHDSTLHVVRVLSNPAGYSSRYEIAKAQEKEMEQYENIILYTVEVAFGDRKFEVTQSDNPCHLQLRTTSELWIKENMINVGVERLLPYDWKYMAWIDADVTFRDKQWALRTMNELQHFAVVQPWSDALDLGVAGNVMKHFKSFGYQHQHGKITIPKNNVGPNFGHTGFAWACTRAFWTAAGGLIEFAILGSADYHMAWACIGQFNDPSQLHPAYMSKCDEWQRQVTPVTYGEVGYIPGRIEHTFHGSKKNRFYLERRSILQKWEFNPDEDLIYNNDGLLNVKSKIGLELDIRRYNRSRNEDSNEEF
jgi:hypothetical protein